MITIDEKCIMRIHKNIADVVQYKSIMNKKVWWSGTVSNVVDYPSSAVFKLSSVLKSESGKRIRELISDELDDIAEAAESASAKGFVHKKKKNY